ncbi:MAG: hypothetical protein MR308_02700 [Lachnospiraceae bacterium]|nr:hypothetical protein [Lachnospiraceae bacterium]
MMEELAFWKHSNQRKMCVISWEDTILENGIFEELVIFIILKLLKKSRTGLKSRVLVFLILFSAAVGY